MKDNTEKLEFQTLAEEVDWLMTRMCALQSIIMNALGMTPEDIERYHARIQAKRDQKEAESGMTGDGP